MICKECKTRGWEDITVIYDGSSLNGYLVQCKNCKRVVLTDDEYPNNSYYSDNEKEKEE